MSAEWPFARKTWRHNGFDYAYADEGAGPPALMVHGNPSWGFYYRRLIALLAGRGRRAVAFDHLGCGLSDKPAETRYDYSLDSRIADLTAFVDEAMPDGPIDLIVHDWGGMIGLGWAVDHPERVRRIVVMNTAAFVIEPGQRFEALRRFSKVPVAAEWLVRGLGTFERRTASFGVKRKPMPQAVREGYLAPYHDWDSRVAVWRFFRDIPMRPGDVNFDRAERVEAGLARLADKPVKVVWGMKDFVFTPRFLGHWREVWPHAEVEEFADAGHYVLEDAWAEAGPSIAAFLER